MAHLRSTFVGLQNVQDKYHTHLWLDYSKQHELSDESSMFDNNINNQQ